MDIRSIWVYNNIFTAMGDVMTEMYATEVYQMSRMYASVQSWDPSTMPSRFHRTYNRLMARSSAMLSSMGLYIQKLEDALICLTDIESNPGNAPLISDAINNACDQYDDLIEKKRIQRKSMKSLLRILQRLEEQLQSQQQASTGG